MLYRLRMTLEGYSDSEDYAEQFLEGFVATHPEAGPVVSQNLIEGTMTVVFSVEAKDHEEAWDLGRPIFAEGGAASGLKPTQIVEITVSRVITRDTNMDVDDHALQHV